ncbi:hypothetical protein AB2B38_010890 [Balneola sp. MJW-20]|uniref:hypothetical protein n=1 Tax=Gracilimonas aurantiaca TaxID=3234185 RepID=UPI00390BD180
MLIFNHYQAVAQVQQSGYVPFRSVDARSLALARSTGSDIASLTVNNLNPASISLINTAVSSYNSYHNWNTNLYSQELSFRSVSLNNHGFLIQLQYFNTGFNSVNYLGSASLNEPDLQNLQVSFGYSYAFNPVFSIGVLGRGYSLSNDSNTAKSLNADLGAIYAPTNYISYSLVFRGIGYGPHYEISDDGSTILRNKNLRESLEYGATLYYPNQTEYTTLSLSAAAEALLGTGNVYFKGGIEVQPVQAAAVRTGYFNGPNDQGFSFGLGLNISSLKLNYSILPDSRALARGHQIELLIKF